MIKGQGGVDVRRLCSVEFRLVTATDQSEDTTGRKTTASVNGENKRR